LALTVDVFHTSLVSELEILFALIDLSASRLAIAVGAGVILLVGRSGLSFAPPSLVFLLLFEDVHADGHGARPAALVVPVASSSPAVSRSDHLVAFGGRPAPAGGLTPAFCVVRGRRVEIAQVQRGGAVALARPSDARLDRVVSGPALILGPGPLLGTVRPWIVPTLFGPFVAGSLLFLVLRLELGEVDRFGSARL